MQMFVNQPTSAGPLVQGVRLAVVIDKEVKVTDTPAGRKLRPDKILGVAPRV